MPEEILSLSTIAERQTINIASKKFPEGKLYELINLSELGPYEYAIILQRDSEQAKLRLQKKKLSPAQERLVNKLLDDSVKLVCLGIEPAVMSALTMQQKQMIVFTWSAHVTAQGAAEGNAQKGRRTTAGSSPGSKRSTVATRSGGSTRPRGR